MQLLVLRCSKVCKVLDLPANTVEERIGDFFELLSINKKFVLLKNGFWDLATKHAQDIVVEDEEELISEDSVDDEEMDIVEDEDEDIFYDGNLDDNDEEEDDLKDLVIIDEEEEI